ncbi:MAG: uracil-DNA glycosylase [Chthoniobacter sp.]|nr:uracil-DNA glycosylase [Chthoniobacter sp.]
MSAIQKKLEEHVAQLRACVRCPKMHRPVVSGGAVVSKVILVGQAPGTREPVAGRPFAWTAGKTLFKWFEQFCGLSETEFRAKIYMAAVCRCFPGKTAAGGDRVPDPLEIANCSGWLRSEIRILQPTLIIPVGKLAMRQFLSVAKLDEVISKKFVVVFDKKPVDVIPLPHPSGASPWHRIEPGKSLLEAAMKRISAHPAMRELR